jgi:uncharacterized repeat protein (TIGR01451 family)
MRDRQMTRRAAMQTALRGAAYSAPAVLAATLPARLAAVSPLPGADIAVTKTVNTAAPPLGGSVIFTITATNHGPAAATDVVVTDNLAIPFTPFGATPSQGTFSTVTGIWTIGPLAVGQTVTLTMPGVVGGTAFTNTATRTASAPPDPNAANDSASASVSPGEIRPPMGVQPATIT